MNVGKKNIELQHCLATRGVYLPLDIVHILRRAERTLQRWYESECGSSNNLASFSIERDEETGVPYRCVYHHTESKVRRYRIADREKGAIKRITDLCQKYELHFYIQTDPRGCALYLAREVLNDRNYSKNGAACCYN